MAVDKAQNKIAAAEASELDQPAGGSRNSEPHSG